MAPLDSFIAIVLLSTLYEGITSSQSNVRIFYSMQSHRFRSSVKANELGNFPCHSPQHGTQICLSVANCCSLVFKPGSKASCKLYSIIPENGNLLEPYPGYDMYYSLEDRKNDWIRVFEANTGKGGMPFEKYKSSLSGTWNSPDNRSLTVFKSSLIENWASLPIQKVKFILEQNAQTAVTLTFDGKQSNKMNWFNQDRLLTSNPWTDLKTSSTNYFSLIGEDTIYKRRFYINKSFDSCVRDEGWLLARDNKDGMACAKAMPSLFNEFPLFLFSPEKTSTYLRDYASADKVLISIQLR